MTVWPRPNADFAEIAVRRLFYRLNGISRTSVAIGMLDDANDLVIAGQIFANSHPHWALVATP
jgi:hypothetical protein